MGCVCPSSDLFHQKFQVTIYADYDETGRDIETAKAFFKGFFPDCASSVVINCDPNYVVPLFNQGQLNFTKVGIVMCETFAESVVWTYLSRQLFL